MKNILKYIIYAIAIIAVSAVIIHITERDSHVDEVKKLQLKLPKSICRGAVVNIVMTIKIAMMLPLHY